MMVIKQPHSSSFIDMQRNNERGTRQSAQAGVTLLELMVVTAIVGILATQAVRNYTYEQKKVRRTEVKLALDAVRDAQRIHYLEHGHYAGTFDDLPFLVDGAVELSPTEMKSRRFTYTISQPRGAASYQVTSVGQLDSDPFPDIHLLDVDHP